MTETTKGVVSTTDTAPLHQTPPDKKTSAAKTHRKEPVDPKDAKASPAEKAEGKHTHEERKADKVTLGKGSAQITFRGGARDGQTSSISSHEHPFLVDDAGDLYVRKDEQEGVFRVYQFTTADGEAHPVEIRSGPSLRGTLERDLDELHTQRKAEAKAKAEKDAEHDKLKAAAAKKK